MWRKMDKLLIIDDERSILELLSTVFTKEGYEVETSLSASKALDLIESQNFDLVISDIKLPEMSGMEILRKVKLKKPELPFVMITAYGSIKQAVEALKVGALDYVLKPFDVEELKIVVAHGLEKGKLKQENIQLRKELEEKHKFENMVGKSQKMKETYRLIERLAGTDSTVLVMAKAEPGRRWRPEPFTSSVIEERGRLSRSIAGLYPRTFWKVSFSATARDLSLGPWPIKKECLKSLSRGRSSWMKWEKCLPGHR